MAFAASLHNHPRSLAGLGDFPADLWDGLADAQEVKKRKVSMTVEHLIVGATGVGYLIVGVLQWTKGEVSNGMIWTGYAFAQVGLWINLK